MSLKLKDLTTKPINLFVVYAPDNTEEGTFERRLSVRSTHFANVQAPIASGFVRVGGALLTPESVETPTSDVKMVGSIYVCEAENLDQVKEMIEADIYYTSGVWDREKIAIFPFLPATSFPLVGHS